MVILHVVDAGQVGGKQKVVEALAIGQRSSGHEVCVAVVMDQGGPAPSCIGPLVKAGVQVAPLALAPRRYLRERAQVAELCDRQHPDILHTHGYRPDVVDAGVARRRGIPTVTTVHGFTGGGRNVLYEWMQRRAYRRFDAVVAVSQPLAEYLIRGGTPSERVHVVLNAWMPSLDPLDASTARRQLSVADGLFHVGWVGRLSREKGLDVLIEALTHLADTPLTVSVMGDGAERHKLQKKAAALGVNSCIKWHGIVPDAGCLFPALDVFVLSSRREGTPIVLFEAMAAGVPVVATEVGGVPYVVTPREALLVPPEDPLALAKAILAVRLDREAAAQRSRAAARRLTARFEVEPWVARYEEIYQKVQGLDAKRLRP